MANQVAPGDAAGCRGGGLQEAISVSEKCKVCGQHGVWQLGRKQP